MVDHRTLKSTEVAELEGVEWQPLPGGELEGRRPKVMCPACREKLRRQARHGAGEAKAGGAGRPTLCFECYRTDLARERALRSIVRTLTDSRGVDSPGWDEASRFQAQLPFAPVNRARLERLRGERTTARAAMKVGTARFADRRRHAQIAARHTLQRVAAAFKAHEAGLVSPGISGEAGPLAAPALLPDAVERRRDATDAAERQLPEAWLPFVVSR